jgi:Fic family protein
LEAATPGRCALTAARSIAQVKLIIAKTKLLEHLRGRINERQQKALLRMFRESPEGFKGGMSAGNYSTITGASRPQRPAIWLLSWKREPGAGSSGSKSPLL